MRPTFTATVTFRTTAPEPAVRAVLTAALTDTTPDAGLYTVTKDGAASTVGDAEDRIVDWLGAVLALQGITTDDYQLQDVTIFLSDRPSPAAVATD